MSRVGRAFLSQSGHAIEGIIEFAPEGASRRADEVCQLCKCGVLSGISVGFEPTESEPIKGGRGWHIKKWTLLECSVVAIPALASATILERSYRGRSRSCSPARTLTAAERQAEMAELGRIGEQQTAERLQSLAGSPAHYAAAIREMDLRDALPTLVGRL